MNVFLLISLSLSLFYCVDVSAYSGSNASESASQVLRAAKDAFDILKDLNKLKKQVKDIKLDIKTPRPRRSSDNFHSYVDKTVSGVRSLFQTYIVQPITRFNFKETPIRLDTIWSHAEGRFIFETLDGELNKSFKSLIGEARTGDIVACRTQTSKFAEHYMMVYGNQLAEVNVLGGKKSTSGNGQLKIRPYTESDFYNSEECLLHENRLMQAARAIDESRRDGKEYQTDARLTGIGNRLSASVDSILASSERRFDYDLYSCNCQDFVLYWAYGYVENHSCIEQLFRDQEIPDRHLLTHLFDYIDRDKSATNRIYGYADSIKFANNLG